jgi:predicted amidohydrolase YtcJ
MGVPAEWIIALLAAVAVSAPHAGAQPRAAPTPDLVLVGGRIFTADSARPWAEAVAIRGERVVALGTTAAIRALAGPRTRRIELGGRTVVPGFNDAHVHLAPPLPGIAFRTSEEPVPDPPLAQVLDSLAALVRRTPTGTWLRTSIDAAMLDDPRARRGALDSVAPRHPVWLAANTGHGVIVNSPALRELGIREDAVDPAGGFYERDRAPYPGRGKGRLTGLLHEYAGWNAARTLRSRQPLSVLVAAFRRSGERALRVGITSVQDMANALDPTTTLRVLRLARLPIRVRTIPMPATDDARRLVSEWPAALSDPAWRAARGTLPVTGGVVGATKWILDGTGIERLSLLRAPYADRPTWSGALNFPLDTLRALLRESLAAGDQPILHVIGDSAIVLVLSAMEALAPDSVWRRLRPRLEHAEWFTADLRPRARRLGVVVVENPIHFTDGPVRMRARFGPARAGQYQPFRALVEAGISLAIGSDGPMDPFLNLLLATTHPDTPREALSREAAVLAYTRGSAHAEHAEGEKGTLAPGMLADIAVLSQDIFTVPADALPATVSVLTLVGGKVAFDAGVLTVRRTSGATTSRAHRP